MGRLAEHLQQPVMPELWAALHAKKKKKTAHAYYLPDQILMGCLLSIFNVPLHGHTPISNEKETLLSIFLQSLYSHYQIV